MGIGKINFKNIFLPQSLFLFLFLVIFPFGQIFRINLNLGNFSVPLTPLDIVVALGAFYSIVFQNKKPVIFKCFVYFLAIALFSLILSIFAFEKQVIYGMFYLLRVSAYAFYLNYVWNFARKSLNNKKLLLDGLLAVSTVSAFFGWIQYFAVPDLKPFYYIGWDMHLYRIAGTFLDPTFLGLIIVFGLLILLYRYLDSQISKKYLWLAVFLLISLAFTYSRASYLALIVGFLVIALVKKKIKKILLWIIGLAIIALLLPTSKNQSIELTRVFSIKAKFTNYAETLEISKKFPIFGVGFNNMCVARNKYIGDESFASHACSGSDSSLLLILATTGVVGLLIFLGGIFNICGLLKGGYNTPIVISSLAALLVHSLFSNSLFYPWIMGYIIALIAVSIKD